MPGASQSGSQVYIGDGIILAGGGNDQPYASQITRSTDYGQTWTNLGDILVGVNDFYGLAYLGNGIVLGATGSYGKIVRSESSNFAVSYPNISSLAIVAVIVIIILIIMAAVVLFNSGLI